MLTGSCPVARRPGRRARATPAGAAPGARVDQGLEMPARGAKPGATGAACPGRIGCAPRLRHAEPPALAILRKLVAQLMND